MGGDVINQCHYWCTEAFSTLCGVGFLVEKSMFFADSQLTHGPMMPIFESVRAILPTQPKLITSEKKRVFGR